MKVLVVATNHTHENLKQEIETGKHHRVDYLELATYLNADYVDYSLTPDTTGVRWIEEKLRMDVRQAVSVAKLVTSSGYDVVLSLSERVGLPLAGLLNKGVKHVVIMHHPMSPKKIKLMQAIQIHERWTKIVAISRAEAKALANALQLPQNDIHVLNTPVDTQFYKPPLVLPPLEEQDHIQSLGLSHRDYPTLIRAMRKLPHVLCHLRVGSTWVHHKAGYENETIPDNIQIQPYVHPSKLRDVYMKNRFVVVPIRNGTQWSAGCTSVQNAQAMGKAVIATRMPGLVDYVLDGETGILVEPENPDAMAEAIDYLWNNPDKAETMGRRGREWMQQNFSLDQWLLKVSNLLKQMTVIIPILLLACVELMGTSVLK